MRFHVCFCRFWLLTSESCITRSAKCLKIPKERNKFSDTCCQHFRMNVNKLTQNSYWKITIANKSCEVIVARIIFTFVYFLGLSISLRLASFEFTNDKQQQTCRQQKHSDIRTKYLYVIRRSFFSIARGPLILTRYTTQFISPHNLEWERNVIAFKSSILHSLVNLNGPT